jgi:hypothetical protein
VVTSAGIANNGDTTGFLVTNTGGQAGMESITAAAFRHLTKPYVSNPGQEWIAGGLSGAAVFDWLLLFGTFGLALLALAGALASAGMFLTHIKSLGVVGTFSSQTSLYLRIATWNLGLPLIVSSVVGGAVAAFLGLLTLQIRRVGSLSFEVLGLGVAIVAVIAVTLTLLCGFAAARSVRTWHPTAD